MIRPFGWLTRPYLLLLVGLALVGAGALVLAGSVPWSSDTLRRQLVANLSERLDSEVELASLEVHVLPHFHVTGSGLVVRYKGRRDVPPLIAVKALAVDASAVGLVRKHIGRVTLSGLEINIPPRPDRQATDGGSPSPATASPDVNRDVKELTIDRMVSTDARVVIIPRDPDKSPKVWMVHQLQMQLMAYDRPMPFKATLTNAVPPGEIQTGGSIGPWRSDDPGETPLEGTFTFANADLSVFKGISGLLSAHGEFGGSLGRLGVHGETDTPQFAVAVGGHPVALHTDYHATVDGTNGETLLDRIDGRFGKTKLVAKGRVVDTPGRQGRTVALDIAMDQARIEDVLRLAVNVPSAPMTGALTLKTAFVLPPGDRDVVDKLRLDGRFGIATARFTDLDIQQKVDELSHRSRGRTRQVKRESVVSNFRGRFQLADATLALQALTFDTPGAQVRLDGTYRLRQERLDFKGLLAMDAKISETQVGIKRLLLKVVDPLFSGHGRGSEIPIKVQGTRSAPLFGPDTRRLFRRGS